MKFLNDLLTGVDGQTYDIIRVSLLLGVLTFLGCSGYHLYSDNVFDFVAFGTGFAALMAGGGAGLGFKAKTEPGATA